jgi:signal transduction histidine kinase
VGLSFSKQVALAHGGSIAALDAAEGGANIRIVI